MANRKRILVVEDQEDLLNLLVLFLQSEGYDLLQAADGHKALQILRDNRVDLMISDVMMPMIDGYHLAQEVHELLGDKAPRIILMTSRDTAKEQSVAVMAGADAFVQKPFKMEDIRKKVTELLK